jgi:hypothetical protein
MALCQMWTVNEKSSIIQLMIIKSLRTLFVVALLVGGFALAVNHYHQYKNTKAQAVQKAAQTAEQRYSAAINAITGKYNTVSQAYITLQAECQKGVTAYDTLSPAVRAKLPAPNCQEE